MNNCLAGTLKEIQLIRLIMKILCNDFKILNIVESNYKTLDILVLVFNLKKKNCDVDIFKFFFVLNFV